MRISDKELREAINELNKVAGLTHTRRFILEGAYGGYRLNRLLTDQGGETHVSPFRGTKREIYYFVIGYLEIADQIKKAKEAN